MRLPQGPGSPDGSGLDVPVAWTCLHERGACRADRVRLQAARAPKGPDVSSDGGQCVVFQGEMKPAMHGLSTVHAPNLQTGAHRPRPAGGPQWEAQASAEMKRTPGDSG